MALAVATLGTTNDRAHRKVHTKRSTGGARWALHLSVRIVLNLSVAAGVALLAFLAIGPRVAHYRTETMLTASMVPYIHPGDVVIVTPEPLSAVRVGQVLTFEAPLADHRIVSHRVVKVTHTASGDVLIKTKGDANALPDPWTAQLTGTTAWQVRAVVPHLGDLIRLLSNKLVKVLSIWTIPLVLVVALVTRIWRRPSPAKA